MMPAAACLPSRLTSLDVFRGVTMAFMILVNNAGGNRSYWPLEHARWDGWTPTDMVFPTFVWIVGLSIAPALGKRLERGESRAGLFGVAARRAFILFLLGVLVYAYPAFDLSTQRGLGVLQRIAICYLATVSIYLTCLVRGRIIWIVGLLVGYWALMTFAPVPEYGAGRLDVEGNFAHYVDRIVLGAHNYRSTRTWDPEGIVSTLPAIATCLLGLLAGAVVGMKRSFGERAVRLAVAGAVLIVAGLLGCHWEPINKKLWSDTFVLFMAGVDFVLFAGFLWAIDGRGWQRFTKPFEWMGMNAIVIYLASEFLDEALSWAHWKQPIYDRVFAGLGSPENASLAYALAYVGLHFLLAWAMHRRAWFVRI